MIFFTVYGVAHEASSGMMAAAYLIAFIAIFFTADITASGGWRFLERETVK